MAVLLLSLLQHSWYPVSDASAPTGGKPRRAGSLLDVDVICELECRLCARPVIERCQQNATQRHDVLVTRQDPTASDR
jgi:hypothetical protein